MVDIKIDGPVSPSDGDVPESALVAAADELFRALEYEEAAAAVGQSRRLALGEAMSFQQFTFPQVIHDLALSLDDGDLFAAAPPFAVRDEFAAFLRDGVALAAANSTEKARSEFIIAPVLLELKRMLKQRFFLFSGVEWEADASRGLNGFCDFLLTARREPVCARRSVCRRGRGEK